MTSLRVRTFSSPHSFRMRENTDQKNSEYCQFSGSERQAGKSSKILLGELLFDTKDYIKRENKKLQSILFFRHISFQFLCYTTRSLMIIRLMIIFLFKMTLELYNSNICQRLIIVLLCKAELKDVLKSLEQASLLYKHPFVIVDSLTESTS